jgi:hypothetical protein
MSSNSIRKEVSFKLLQDIDRAERNIVSVASRKVFQTAQVSQCLVLDRKGITALVKGFEAGIGRKLTTYERGKYRPAVKAFFVSIKKSFPEIPEKKHFVRILAQHRLKLDVNIVYLGVSFQTIKDTYHRFNEDFITSEKTPKSLNDEKYSREAASKQTEFDHGAQGTAVATLGGGAAAVAVALDRGTDFDELKQVASDNLLALIDSRMADLSKSAKSKVYNRLFDIVINWEQIVSSSGGVKEGAGIVVSARLRDENNKRASIEKEEFNILVDAIDAAAQNIDWTEVKGSSNLRQKMQKRAIKSLTDRLEAIGADVKLDPELKKAQEKTKNKVTDKSKKNNKGSKTSAYSKKRGKLAGAVLAAKGAPKRKKSNVNITSLLGILNDQLPKVVAKNMGAPALNYRTGRFAGSVRATDIAITAKGHPSIGYTYLRDPYEVFESSSGSRFSSVARDPRKLIDFSIREIAASQVVTRLYTRRV